MKKPSENPYRVDWQALSFKANIAGIGYCLAIISGLVPAILTKDCHSNFLSSSIFKIAATGGGFYFLGIVSPAVSTAIILMFVFVSNAIIFTQRKNIIRGSLINRSAIWSIRKRKEINKDSSPLIIQNVIGFTMFMAATVILVPTLRDIFVWDAVVRAHQIAKVTCDPLEGKLPPPDARFPYQTIPD